MLKSLLGTLDDAYDARRHRDLLKALWEQERWFDTPRQRRAAEIARDAMLEAGLDEAKIVPFAADGRMRWQDWTTHLAWDCAAGQLSIGDEVLADRSTCPQAVVQWSGPLAPITAQVIDGDALPAIDAAQVAGKFVLTGNRPLQMKQRLKGSGAVAVVSDFLGEGVGYDADTTRWCNTWADGPDGWYFRAGDAVMPGFCLTPQQGARLRERMAGDPNLRLTGCCRSRLYEGHSHCVTGVIPGQDASREVWLFGHACEQGANDNCSGVSVLVEAGRLLTGLIRKGLLPRPRLSIRVITTEECLGMLAFVTEQDSLRRRALVGLNLDSVGDPSDPDRPFKVFFGPLSSPTFGWAAAAAIGRLLAEQSRGAYHFQTQCQPPAADDMIADPNCGIPTLWLGRGQNSVGYHSSRDTPDVCCDASLRCSALLATAWAYIMADLDDALMESLLPHATRWAQEQLLPASGEDAMQLRRWVAGRMLRDAGRFGVSASVYGPAAARYCADQAEPLNDLPAAGRRFIRRTWGTCTLETLPPDRTRGLGRWSLWQAAGLYWNHSGRTLAAAERLTRAEVAQCPEGGLLRLMEACVEAGLAEEA